MTACRGSALTHKTPRHILMTADTIGGVWTFALELVRGLHPYGIEVTLATMGNLPSAEQRSEAREVPNLTLCESEFRLEWMEHPWEEVRLAGEWLLSLEEQLQPDLVHLNGYAHGCLPWRTPCLVTAHSCVLSWWAMVKHTGLPEPFMRYRDEVARGLAAADLVTAPSSAMLQALETHYLSLPGARVIHNARCPNLFQQARKEPFILSVGRIWDEAKNLACVAQAAPLLPWPVYVAGDTEHPDGGAAALDHVVHLGKLPSRQLAGWFERCSIYALPARYEPFGLSVLEAAICRCALVLGDIPSLRELWDGAAVFVPPEEPGTVTAALLSLCRDPAYLERMAGEARRRSMRFSTDRMAAEYLEAYRAAARNYHKAPAARGERAAQCVL